MFTKIFLYLHSETVSGFGIVRGVAQPGLEYASGGRVVASSNLVTPTISFKESTGRLTPCPFKFSIGLCTAVRSVLDAWIAVSSRAGYKIDPRAAAPDVSVSRGRLSVGLPIQRWFADPILYATNQLVMMLGSTSANFLPK